MLREVLRKNTCQLITQKKNGVIVIYGNKTKKRTSHKIYELTTHRQPLNELKHVFPEKLNSTQKIKLRHRNN